MTTCAGGTAGRLKWVVIVALLVGCHRSIPPDRDIVAGRQSETDQRPAERPTPPDDVTPPADVEQKVAPETSSDRSAIDQEPSAASTKTDAPVAAAHPPTQSTPRDQQTASLESDEEQPRVVLSQGHQETCLLRVGDVFPNATVTDMSGADRRLSDLLGQPLNVLIFWNESSATGAEQFRRIPVDILAGYAQHGVRVIAVHEDGDVQRVRELTGDAADKIVSVVDPGGRLFAQVATSMIPRTYLLDRNGRILWFDIEYSPSMQRALDQALEYYLTHQSNS